MNACDTSPVTAEQLVAGRASDVLAVELKDLRENQQSRQQKQLEMQ